MENIASHGSALSLNNGLEVTYDRTGGGPTGSAGGLISPAGPLVSEGKKLASLTAHSGHKLIITKTSRFTSSARRLSLGPAGSGTVGAMRPSPSSLSEGRNRCGPLLCDLVHSIRGNTFEGVSFGDQLVIFSYEPWLPFAGTTYVASAEAVFHHLVGFPSHSSFTVAFQQLARDFAQVSVTPGGAFSTGAEGVLAFVASSYGPINLLKQESDTFLDAFFGGAASEAKESGAPFAYLGAGRSA